MPDPIDSSQSPAAVLAGTQPPQLSDAPLNSRLGQAPSLPVQPPQPTPQQTVAAHHSALGQAASFLFGSQRNPNTGEPVKQAPGAVFRSLLAGALLGGAIGSEGQGGFISGLARGGNAVVQQTNQRQQAAQQAAFEQNQRRQQMTLEQQRAADEHVLHQATAAKIVAETTAFHHQQEFHDQEVIDQKNAAAGQYVKTLLDAGGTSAPIPINGKVPSNGIYSAPELADAFTRDPSILRGAPNTTRHFIDQHNASDLEYVEGKGWTNESGDPVDLSKSTTVRVIDVPENLYRIKMQRTGKELNSIAGYQLIPRDQENNTFNAPLDAISSLYAANLKNANSQAQAKQRNAAAVKSTAQATNNKDTKAQQAIINTAKANIGQLESDKRALMRQGFDQDTDAVKTIDQKIEAEKQRQQDAINQMQGGTKAKPQPQKNATPSSSKQTFSPSKWHAANPNGDLNAAIAEAKRQGYQVAQ